MGDVRRGRRLPSNHKHQLQKKEEKWDGKGMKSEETDNQQCCLFCRISVVFLFNILSLFMDPFMMKVCFRFMAVGGRGGVETPPPSLSCFYNLSA